MPPRRAPRRRTSSTIDIGRMSKAVQRPGIDPRVWAVRGWVTAVHLDEDHGYFVDVTLQTGEEETARVGASYAGAGYGDHDPIQVDDEVMMVAPMGDYNSGLVVVARLHSKSDQPPAEAKDNPTDRLIRLKKDTTLRIIVDGGGKIVLKVKDGKVLLGAETGTLPSARKTDPLTASSQMAAWALILETFVNGLVPGTFTPANSFAGVTPANPGKAEQFGTIANGSTKTESA